MYSSPSLSVYSILTACALIVIPRSLSISILSKTWLSISRLESTPVISISLSAKVDFPWSICAIILKFLMFFCLSINLCVPPLISDYYFITKSMDLSIIPFKIKSYFILINEIAFLFNLLLFWF